MLVHSTHATLLARLADHADADAWFEFTARYGDLIRSFCRRRGLQPSDCDDVAQEVLLSLAKAMPGFEYDPARGKFRSYLKTVTVHAISRRGRQKFVAGGLSSVGTSDVAADFGGADEDESQWEVEWRQHHLRQAMRRVEAEFNERDRLAFMRYALEGHSVADAAAELGMSADQIYQAKSRILRRLTEFIAEQVAEEG
jgi:RNA polymerase sigma-70 factor (ECF subfamily)